jgi:hypothetical protein
MSWHIQSGYDTMHWIGRTLDFLASVIRSILSSNWGIFKIPSSGMLHFVTLVRTDVPKELSASIIKVVFVRFEVFTAVTMKNGVFRDVTPCGSCKNPRFGGT